MGRYGVEKRHGSRRGSIPMITDDWMEKEIFREAGEVRVDQGIE